LVKSSVSQRIRGIADERLCAGSLDIGNEDADLPTDYYACYYQAMLIEEQLAIERSAKH
jgi:hypothetical protein